MNIYEFARLMIDRVEEFKNQRIRDGDSDIDDYPEHELLLEFEEWMSSYDE